MTLGILLIFAVLAPAAGVAPAPGTGNFPRGEIVPRVVCEADPEQSYALYLPKAYSAGRKWPVLYLYDPRRRGAVAAELFREGAERYGWILASSNNTVSDDPTARNDVAARAVWLDANARFSVDPRRAYATGFSGGARLAALLAQKLAPDVAGVILCGGGFAESSPPQKAMPFAVFGTVGNVDFNFGEMRRLDRTLAELGAAHRLAVFDGPHSWCPATVCTEAVEWLELQAMKSGTRSKDGDLVARLLRERVARAAALESGGKTAEALVRYSEIAEDFRGLADTKDAEAASARLGSPAIRKELAEQQRREDSEQGRVAKLWSDLTAALASEPLPPATTVANRIGVRQLLREAAPERPEAERLSAKRVIAQIFVQAAFYVPRELAAKHDFARAELLTGVAAELVPERAGGAWYNLACFRALAGDRKGAIAGLKTAVRTGYRDVAAMEADTDLASIREDPAYRAIVEELKR